MNRRKHIAILAHGATGTSAIYAQLLNNSQVHNTLNKEPLNVLKVNRPNPQLLEGLHWYKHIKTYMLEAEAVGKRLVIHLKPAHTRRLGLSFEDIVGALSPDFNFVHTTRKNHIARAVSTAGKILDREDTIRIRRGIECEHVDKLILPERNYVKYVEDAIADDEEIKSAIIRHCCTPKYYVVDYDAQLCTMGPKGVAAGITENLGFYEEYEYEPIYNTYHSEKNRWSDMLIKDKVANFEDLYKDLHGTDYEWMIYE